MSLMIIITTPDYPPKLGGLSTFTKNIENQIRKFAQVEIFVWQSLRDLKRFERKRDYDYAIHVHFMAGVICNFGIHCRNINFLHGSELVMTSPNFVKKMAKGFLKKRFYEYLEGSHFNFFISQFTQIFAQENGLKLDYARDYVFHNLIEIKADHFVEFPLNHKIILCCIARDVPHKNIDGAVNWASAICESSGCEVELHINAKRATKDSRVKLIIHENLLDIEREKIYQNCHFNLLPSLNHSKRGFFEGFGLTVLEAGKYGTPSIVYAHQGGQEESVHHLESGFVINSDQDLIALFKGLSKESYIQMRLKTFQHIKENHNCEKYFDLFQKVMN